MIAPTAVTTAILGPLDFALLSALKTVLETRGYAYVVDPGEGTFYGPKIDIKIKDSIERAWQCSTIQVDFHNPTRFQLEFIGEDGKAHQPGMIHRALLGSLERFFGVLIEHYAGAFPLWLAPEQVRVLPIADAQNDAARALHERLVAAGIRSHFDDRSQTLNYKVRDGETLKVPYLAVVGAREAEARTVAVRNRGVEGRKQDVMAQHEFVNTLLDQIRTRARVP